MIRQVSYKGTAARVEVLGDHSLTPQDLEFFARLVFSCTGLNRKGIETMQYLLGETSRRAVEEGLV